MNEIKEKCTHNFFDSNRNEKIVQSETDLRMNHKVLSCQVKLNTASK